MIHDTRVLILMINDILHPFQGLLSSCAEESIYCIILRPATDSSFMTAMKTRCAGPQQQVEHRMQEGF